MNFELFNNMLQKNAPDFVKDQVNFWVAMAREAIALDEREKVIAFASVRDEQLARQISNEEHLQ